MCEMLGATQFLQHFLASLQYNIILQGDTLEQAKWELRTMIREARSEMKLAQKWPHLTKRLPSSRPIPPSGMRFPKEEICEWEGLLKMRHVISHLRHPSANAGHLVGRCLSLVICARLDMPDNLEIWNMQGCRDMFVRACDASARDRHEWCGAELDMVNTYTEIPTEHVHKAIVYGIQRIEARTSSR